MILAFKIPEAPYSDEAFALLHKAFEVTHGVLATLEIFGVELAGLGIAGLGLTVLAPVAAFVGGLMALGAGYAEAQAIVSKDRMKWGFAEGLAVGADSATSVSRVIRWKFVKSLFWVGQPEFNAFDPKAGAIAQKAYNLGLACGFVQGYDLTAKQKKFLWQSIAKELTQGDYAEFAGDHRMWPDIRWRDYYIAMAAKFIKLYVKD